MNIKKEDFNTTLVLIEQQIEKERKLAEYLSVNRIIDGHFIIEISSNLIMQMVRLLNIMTLDESKEGEESWVDWWVFENDFGRKNLSVFFKDKELKLKTNEEFYDFIVEFNNERGN